jgi:hypothetical protein
MSDERVLARARAVWREAMDRDEAFVSRDRERRLAVAPPARGPSDGQSDPLRRHAIVALAFLVAVAWVATRGGRHVVARTADSRQAASIAKATAELEPVAAPGAGLDRPAPRSSPGTSRQLVATAPCFGCRRAGSDATSVAAGERLVPGERVHVPAGSTLLLCWGIGADAAEQVAIAGPAAIVVTSTGAIETVSVEPGGVPAMPPRAPAQARDPESVWRAAQAALQAGDRARAEHDLRTLLVSTAPLGLRERAAFALAEIELARGDTDEGRRHLEALRGSPDAELAADAVFLEARTSTSPAERAALYARFLASGPPSPYREQAAVDEAVALLEAGDVSGARARAAALRAKGHLPGIASEALERLERALAAEPGDR